MRWVASTMIALRCEVVLWEFMEAWDFCIKLEWIVRQIDDGLLAFPCVVHMKNSGEGASRFVSLQSKFVYDNIWRKEVEDTEECFLIEIIGTRGYMTFTMHVVMCMMENFCTTNAFQRSLKCLQTCLLYEVGQPLGMQHLKFRVHFTFLVWEKHSLNVEHRRWRFNWSHRRYLTRLPHRRGFLGYLKQIYI